MNFLLDEMWNERLAPALSLLSDEDQFRHVAAEGHGGTLDADIPPLCNDLNTDVLITVNVTDFGARKVLYQALLDAGVTVVVVRPGRGRFDTNQQMSVLTRHLERIRREIARSEAPRLVVVTQSDVRVRTLDDLIAEMSREGKRLP